MPNHLNARQRQILDFLRDHSQTHAYPPTVREIGQAVGLSSSSTVQNHLNTLETRGFIKRDPSKSRTVEIVDSEAAGAAPQRLGNIIQLPLVGRVAAGTPILAAENIENTLTVGPEIGGSGDSYALTVHGDSMIGAGINDGDIVVVRPRRDAPPNGTIVVARVENGNTGESEVTVKRFFRESDRVRLQPENPSLDPIYARDVSLEGVVTAVIRLLG
ncbi:MAG: transcriptional repressor LexA [Candidatus Dormibacteraeota bacterium]|nr:transcriptional repressor LexA [Candidatus Dormibacteraeota bacterium]MBV9524958.1 transcriptional repressor LexA [Candidatus Dormibacteraeota bacterium]